MNATSSSFGGAIRASAIAVALVEPEAARMAHEAAPWTPLRKPIAFRLEGAGAEAKATLGVACGGEVAGATLALGTEAATRYAGSLAAVRPRMATRLQAVARGRAVRVKRWTARARAALAAARKTGEATALLERSEAALASHVPKRLLVKLRKAARTEEDAAKARAARASAKEAHDELSVRACPHGLPRPPLRPGRSDLGARSLC